MAESHLEIKTLMQLSQALADFENQPELASRVRNIQIQENDVEDEPDAGDDAEDDAKRNTAQAWSFCAGITSILEEIARTNRLESFKWIVSYYISPLPSRPKQCWEALSKVAPTLKGLHLSFYNHEIHHLITQGINPVPLTFGNLEFLTLSMDGGHGDDAVHFDSMLRQTPKLRSLSLSLPLCDLENCRIKGLTYDWKFPILEHFSISAFLNDDSGIPAFLARHPSIRSLSYDVDSETPIPEPFSGLPNLVALDLTSWRYNHRVCGIPLVRQLRVGSSTSGMAAALSSVDLTMLCCLEIQSSYWHEETVQNLMNETLPKLTQLVEFGVDFQSGDLSWYEDGKRINPDPLDLELLVCARNLVLYIVEFDVLIRIVAQDSWILSKKL
jgi:hypothetical protein